MDPEFEILWTFQTKFDGNAVLYHSLQVHVQWLTTQLPKAIESRQCFHVTQLGIMYFHFYLLDMTNSKMPSSATSNDPLTPSVVNDQNKWTFYCSQVNLPAVLNDPRKSKRELDFLTKTWGETFVEKTEILPSLHLPNITRSHFDGYLRRVTTVSRSFMFLFG